jgi:hypothetical protein
VNRGKRKYHRLSVYDYVYFDRYIASLSIVRTTIEGI